MSIACAADAATGGAKLLRKHVNNQDIAIEVLKSFYVKEKDLWKLKVRWWNIGVCHPPWCMGITEKLSISNKELKTNWKAYEWRPVNRQLVKEILNGNK